MKTDETARALTAQRDARGRFTSGTAPGPGRPPGLINTVTASLREQILQGFDRRGVAQFVEDLLETSPPSAAALLVRMLPPEANDEQGPAKIESVDLVTVPRGHYFLSSDLNADPWTYEQGEVDAIQAIRTAASARADKLRQTFLPDDAA